MTLAAYDPPWMPPCATPGVGRSSCHGCDRRVADHEDLRVARDRQVRLDDHPTDPIGLRPGRRRDLPRERRRLDPGRPQDRPRRDRLLRAVGREHADVPVVDLDDPRLRPDLDAESLQLPLRRRRASGRVRRQHPVHGLDEDDLRVGGTDRPEVALERVAGDLAERPGQLDPGRAAADEHERHPLAAPLRVGLALGGLEGDEDLAADLGRVLDGLEALRDGRPLRMVEVAVVRPGRDDQRVVVDRAAVREQDLALLDIDADGLAEDDRRVPVPPEHRAQRLGDVTGRQGARGDLVEHRLEQVEVAPVDERDPDLGIDAEVARGIQAGEPAADDRHAMRRARLLDRGGWVGGRRGRWGR